MPAKLNAAVLVESSLAVPQILPVQLAVEVLHVVGEQLAVAELPVVELLAVGLLAGPMHPVAGQRPLLWWLLPLPVVQQLAVE